MRQPARQPRPPFAAIVFAGLALLLPLPVLVFDGFVPLVRIWLLTAVSVAVALTEGAAGPVGMITMLFVAHAAIYAILLALAARLIARGLRRMRRRAAIAVVIATLLLGIAVALSTRPYITPFGLTPRSNLLGVLS